MPVEKVELTPQAALEFEKAAFIRECPEFFSTPGNGRAIAEYVHKHGRPQNASNFKWAFERLREEGKMFEPTAAKMAMLPAGEYLALAKQHGTPVYDYRGVVTQYDWDEKHSYLPAAETDDSPRRLSKHQMRHPEDHGRVPTKREFAMWSAERQKEWCQSNGSWGRALPELR